MKLYKRQKKGEKLSDVFEYINDVDKVGIIKSNASSPEYYCNLDNVIETLKHLSLVVFKRTNEMMNESQAPNKAK